MRLPGPMTDDDFDAALADALRGRVSSDSGANDATQDALDEVARSAPDVPERLIERARAAFKAQSGA